MKERFSARGYIVERATAALSRMFKRQIAGGMKRATHPSAILRWDAGWCFQWNQKLSEVRLYFKCQISAIFRATLTHSIGAEPTSSLRLDPALYVIEVAVGHLVSISLRWQDKR